MGQQLHKQSAIATQPRPCANLDTKVTNSSYVDLVGFQDLLQPVSITLYSTFPTYPTRLLSKLFRKKPVWPLGALFSGATWIRD